MNGMKRLLAASLLAANGTESALNHMMAFHRYITREPAPAIAQH